MRFRNSMTVRAWLAGLLLVGAAACHHAQPPVARPMPPVPPPATTAGTRPPEPPPPVREPLMPAEPLPSDSVASRSLDDLNRNSPLQPAYFDYDSADLNDTGRAALQADAGVLKKYPTWAVTIEGHAKSGSVESLAVPVASFPGNEAVAEIVGDDVGVGGLLHAEGALLPG